MILQIRAGRYLNLAYDISCHNNITIITKYCDIIVWDHFTIANSNIKIKKQERQLNNRGKNRSAPIIGKKKRKIR